MVTPLVLAVCLASLTARAESPGGESPRVAAQARLVEGVALLKQADYAGALAKFQDAYRLVPSPNIHYDLGLAYAGLGRSAEALDAFERFLTDAPNAPGETRRKARANAETMRGRVAALAISADPPGSEILVDGVPRGVTPLSLTLDPGRHEVAARGPGGVVGPVQTVVVEAGATVTLSLPGPTAVAGVPAAAGMTAGGVGPTPAPRPGPPVLLEKAETGTAASRTPRVWATASAALGVALLGTGATFALLARRQGNKLTQLSELGQRTMPPERPPQFQPSTESSGRSYDTLALVSVGAGVVALATGAIIFAVNRQRPSPAPEPRAGIVPVAIAPLLMGGTPGGASLHLQF